MTLFEDKPKKDMTIPGELGFSQDRADTIIRGVRKSYRDNQGDIVKCMKQIKSELKFGNEYDFAMYTLGAIKMIEGGASTNGAVELTGLLRMLEKLERRK